MKRLPAACAALLASTAMAEDCRLTLSESRIDFGLISRMGALYSGPERLLGEGRLNVSLNCPDTRDMSLFYRAVTAGAQRLRFTERGSYGLQVQDAVLDGQAVELGVLNGRGVAPTARGNALSWQAGQAVAPLRDGVPAMGKSLALTLQVKAWAPHEATQVRDATTWETIGLIDAPGTGQNRELSLTARFAPASCEPTLSDNGLVDYGLMHARDLNPDKDTVLPTRSLLLNIACDGPAHYALRMVDNRDGSATGGTSETAYGLSLDNSQNKIGRFYVYIDPLQTRADELPQVYRTDSTTAGSAWSSASAFQIPLGARSYLGFTDTAGSTHGPVAIQHLNTTLSVSTFLAPMNSLDLTAEVELDGSATLEVIYL
ncbi:DUF1120 domain-containing protein [Pseudomonas sp. R5-89-07]|uniref:DUF1120 domain-containing protein n=1 Tax=Pseudomonas sp. R5-89-07 TaxID=658644 RepID=UPI000F560B6A|nr:DUF1120 domain-containing protein [Pseudomonas sp. R5-89-07]AZF03879.1 Beta-fimbriae probable major subunit [Pseudomonas sp. R5-89-07]